MMRNTRCMGVLRLIMLPFRIDELRGEPPLELVAVEALHVVGLLEKAKRWVGRVQPVGRIDNKRIEEEVLRKVEQKQGFDLMRENRTGEIKQDFQRQNMSAALSTQVIAHLHSLKPSHMR